jgi:hypothetical protein
MFEKLYGLLLRLYPSAFRREYQAAALRLMRDRLRDESGFFNRIRLGWDLVTDLLVGLPQAHRNSYPQIETVSLAPIPSGIPSFKILHREPLGRGSILVAGLVSLLAAAAFGFVLTHPIAYLPLPGSNARMSPIESVLEHLNRAAISDAAAIQPQTASPASAPAGKTPTQSSSSAGPNVPETAPSLPISANTAIANTSSEVDLPQKHNPAAVFATLPTTSRTLKPIPETSSAHNLRADPNLPAAGLTAGAPAIAHAKPFNNHAPVPAAEPRLENAGSGMMSLFQTHDIVMFGEVHNSRQEYEWLCKLVKTPGFADHVDDIVVEFGNALHQDTVDRYVSGEDVPFDEVQKAWRDMVADAEPVSPVYSWLYKAVRESNLQHPGRRGIRLLMGSPPGDWRRIKNAADLAPYEAEREQFYADVVKREVLAKHHHALLIMGAGHFLRGHDQALQFELAMQQHRPLPPGNAPLHSGYIESQLRAAGANPYLVVFGTNAIDNRGNVDPRFDSWPAPVLVPLAGNWVGTLPAQPVISGGHAPAIPLTLAEQADALLYVAPCNALETANLPKADLDGTPYGREVIRRDIILLGHPVPFSYGALPQCVQPQQSSR